MKKIFQKLGIMAFWLGWPAIWLILRRGSRSRVIILSPDNQVLLVKSWIGSGKWILPGGGIHRKEDLIKGTIREVKEETGITLNPKELHFIKQYDMNDRGLIFNGLVFLVRLNEKPKASKQKLEISELCWLPLNKLTNLSPLTKELLENYSK